MSNNAPRHPFVVGEKYRNEDGVYTVVEIADPQMEIQYEDGRTLRSSIRLQRRIWERIQHEEEIAARRAAKKTTTRRRGGGRSRASFGRDFHGLQESDFRRDITGTSWRRRTELAGLLALRLSEMSGHIFESHAVYRRPEVYVVQPEHWNSKEPQRAVKFFFKLTEAESSYGFLVEKSDKPMDHHWDWARFMATLGDDKSLQARTLIAMEHCNLSWEVYPGGGGLTAAAPYTVTADQETLQLQDANGGPRTPLAWEGFIELLAEAPADTWCDCYLTARADKAQAIEKGVGLATEAANVYNALLPLYAASVRR